MYFRQRFFEEAHHNIKLINMKTTTILGLMLFMPFYLFSQCQIEIEFDDSEPFCGELPEAIDLLTYSDNGDPECSEIDYFEYEWSISIPGEGYSELGEQGPITSFSEVLLDPSFNNPYDNVNWIGLRLSAFNEQGDTVDTTYDSINVSDSFESFDIIDYIDVDCASTCLDLSSLGYAANINGLLQNGTYCFDQVGTYVIEIQNPCLNSYSIDITEEMLYGSTEGNSCENAIPTEPSTIYEQNFCYEATEQIDLIPSFNDDSENAWYSLNTGDFTTLNYAIQGCNLQTGSVNLLEVISCGSVDMPGQYELVFQNQIPDFCSPDGEIEGLNPNTQYLLVVNGTSSLNFELIYTLSNEAAPLNGCMNPDNCEYVPSAIYPGFCPPTGCTDPTACNFNGYEDGCDDGSCIYLDTFTLYNDLNLNGIYEDGEALGNENLGSWTIEESGEVLTNGEEGVVSLPAPIASGESITLSFNDQGSGWSTLNQTVVLSNDSCPVDGQFLIPMVAPGDGTEILMAPSWFTSLDVLCNQSNHIGMLLWNQVPGVVNGTVTLTFPDYVGAFTPSYGIEPSSYGTTSVTWDIASLPQNQGQSFVVDLAAPGFQLMGETMELQFTVSLTDDQGNEFNETFDHEATIVCAYDPNDITGYPEGYSDMKYVGQGEEMMYRIRFQNTGTAPAQDVEIVNALDNTVFDFSTFQPLESSHAFTSMINENGEAVFTFENIMLPDSSADLEGSQGFVTYNIQLLDPLAHDTQISNQAEIYFDQNPSIITNQEQHHVFECNTLQIPVAIGGFVLCEGDSLYADFGQDYVDTYEIIVQGTTYTNETGDFEILPTETGMSTVEMTVMNPICTNSITTQLNVLTPPDAEILEEDGTLYAENGIAFVWLLDGETVAQGLSNEYTPTESGEYQVIVADLTGCATISEPFDFVVGISESSIQDIKVFPNPAYDVIQFELPNANWTVQIRDSRGVLIQESEANGGTNRVALNDYANGMYFIIMSDGDGALLRSTFIKK